MTSTQKQRIEKVLSEQLLLRQAPGYIAPYEPPEEPVESQPSAWRLHCSEQLLAGSRVVKTMLFTLRCGTEPSKKMFLEAARRDFTWFPEALAKLWLEFSGEALDIGALAPTAEQLASAEERQLKPGGPVWKFRPEGAPFIGIQRQGGGRFGATIRHNGRDKWLGTFPSEMEAASAFDSYRRAQGLGGRLNFRSSLDAQPHNTALKVAA